MLPHVRMRPRYADVTATLALVVALGGGAYAATALPANSVGAKQLKKNAVERAKIKNKAVDGSKVRDNSLTGSDVDESSLAKVPSAALADTAASAAALDKAVYKFATATAPANAASTAATASCDAGQHVIGGGVRVDDPVNALTDDSYPDLNNTAWTAHVATSPSGSVNFTVYAICTAITTVG